MGDWAESPTVPLRLFWHDERQDDITAASEEQIELSTSLGYAEVSTQGWIFKEQVPGTTALWQLWHDGRQSSMTVIEDGESMAGAEEFGYGRVRIEGYVFAHKVAGTIPLMQMWHDERTSDLAVAQPDSIGAAEENGYGMVRKECYIFPHMLAPVSLGWHDERNDSITTANPEQKNLSFGELGYSEVRVEGYAFLEPVKGTREVYQYWNEGRNSSMTCMHPESIESAEGCGYGRVRTDFFAFKKHRKKANTVPLRQFWHDDRTDDLCVGHEDSVCHCCEVGYAEIRTEGHIYPRDLNFLEDDSCSSDSEGCEW